LAAPTAEEKRTVRKNIIGVADNEILLKANRKRDNMSNWILTLNVNSGAITAIATVVLVIITGIYVYLTHKIAKGSEEVIEQASIDREIAYIRDQLEEFYYPLFLVVSEMNDVENPGKAVSDLFNK